MHLFHVPLTAEPVRWPAGSHLKAPLNPHSARIGYRHQMKRSLFHHHKLVLNPAPVLNHSTLSGPSQSRHCCSFSDFHPFFFLFFYDLMWSTVWSLGANLASLGNNLGSMLAVPSGHSCVHHSGYIWAQDLPNPVLSLVIPPGSAQPFGKRQKTQQIRLLVIES